MAAFPVSVSKIDNRFGRLELTKTYLKELEEFEKQVLAAVEELLRDIHLLKLACLK